VLVKKKTRYEDSEIIALAVTELLDPRLYVIAPNVYWGLGLGYEADMLVMDGQNRITEVEIKVSKSDLRKDFVNKAEKHRHRIAVMAGKAQDAVVTRMVFAVPEKLLGLALEIVPKRYGLIVVERTEADKYHCQDYDLVKARWVRTCRHPASAPGIGTAKALELNRNLSIKYWSLKRKLFNIR